MLDLLTAQRAWQLSPVLASWTPDSGTIHETLLLQTAAGNYALRAYRYTVEERERIVYEHALIAYAREHGLPALVPMPLVDGTGILEHEGHFYALFPFATGQQIKRGSLTPDVARMMGTFLGELHRALSAYPQNAVQQRNLSVQSAQTFVEIATIEAAIRARPYPNDQDKLILAGLAQRRNWLAERVGRRRDSDLASLEQQVIHGDYQETNLFFVDGRVSAVIDWDQAYVAPRAWEVVRTLHLAFHLRAPTCRAFLAAYRKVLPLPCVDLETAAAVYGWKRAHDLWVYKELYLQGNQRVRAFLHAEQPFVPFETTWAVLRDALSVD